MALKFAYLTASDYFVFAVFVATGEELITTFGFWWAGLGQVAVGLFELLHGNTFGNMFMYGTLLANTICSG